MPESDEFDQQLRDLTSGRVEPPKFTELSAAERARRVPAPPPPPAKQNWRNARKARQLRKPVGEQGRGGPRPGGPKGHPQPQAKGKPAGGRRRQFLTVVRTVGILVAFCALLYGLHLLGFGPQ